MHDGVSLQATCQHSCQWTPRKFNLQWYVSVVAFSVTQFIENCCCTSHFPSQILAWVMYGGFGGMIQVGIVMVCAVLLAAHTGVCVHLLVVCSIPALYCGVLHSAGSGSRRCLWCIGPVACWSHNRSAYEQHPGWSGRVLMFFFSSRPFHDSWITACVYVNTTSVAPQICRKSNRSAQALQLRHCKVLRRSRPMVGCRGLNSVSGLPEAKS